MECKHCKSYIEVVLNQMVECPNGCVSCTYCGGLLADNEMEENGYVEAVFNKLGLLKFIQYKTITDNNYQNSVEIFIQKWNC